MCSKHDKDQDCVCEAVEELECLLTRKHHEFVAIATTSGDVKFGWVHKVHNEVLLLKFVLFYSPACPCAPLFAYKAFIPLYQITDVLDAPDMGEKPYRDAFQRIDAWRKQEEDSAGS
jgi:hypothetical protein